MKRYWTEATYLLETLVLLAKLFDDDGMDLYFPFSTLQNKRARRTNEDPFKPAVKGKKDETNFVKAMQDHSPNGKAADITQSIQHIFDEFFEMRKPKQRPWARASEATKALTLIILTDGIWKGMENPNGINRYVENLLKELSKRGSLGSGDERSVSIEFIQFGDDPEATERLRALDDDMEFKGYPYVTTHHPPPPPFLLRTPADLFAGTSSTTRCSQLMAACGKCF